MVMMLVLFVSMVNMQKPSKHGSLERRLGNTSHAAHQTRPTATANAALSNSRSPQAPCIGRGWGGGAGSVGRRGGGVKPSAA